jgi:ATPase family associated with various cellular activities (AAA)
MLAEEDRELAAQPVSSSALLTRVRLRGRRRLLWMQSQSNSVSSANLAALAIPTAEVERILEDATEVAGKEQAFYQADRSARALTEQINLADREFSNEPAWRHLRQQFEMSDFEVDLLALSIAASIDPSLHRAYAYLHDDAGADYATPWLAGMLFEHSPLPSLNPEMPLVKWRLAHALDSTANPWAANAPWNADPHIMLWLSGSATIDPLLGSAVQFFSAQNSAGQLCLYPEQLAEMLECARGLARDSTMPAQEASMALEIELLGPAGAGKRTLAAQFVAALGADLMTVDTEALLAPDTPRPAEKERLLHAIRMARLAGAILYWHGDAGISSRIWQAIGSGSGVMLFGTPVARTGPNKSTRLSFTLPALRSNLKVALWQRLTSSPAPAYVEEWTLTPAEIVKAAQLAPLGERVIESVRDSLQIAQNELFSPVACPFTWDDIVLSPHLREHLAELEQQVRLRSAVYEHWGFERLCPLGRGITALFSGPSGTGKTMAALVLARSLGMKVFRVDLSGVMNKYIGETEKRLKQVFDSCERANVLLFFDEADALFGQRTQVKDAHDRFANIEIDYLLQRMEQFEGVAILATNRKGDLDKAFVRRIRFILDFVPPAPAERLTLWKRALLSRSPTGEELLDSVDLNALANKLNMTGAEITQTALGAAFLARGEGTRISMKHVLHAARREMSKNGVVMRVGEWEA